MEWWERPYPESSKPVTSIELPRALYIPSFGKGTFEGDDVLAYKRAVWRGGRWPGPASNFDKVYSNNFGSGKGPNVVDTGVAGLQRQSQIDDTGNLGKATFEVLVYGLIPDGLPNAGQPLMDGTAVDLLENFARNWPPIPNLGPVYSGGKSVLDHDLTHATGGIPLYPAFDDAFNEGVKIIAPEPIEVTKASSSNPGDACYAQGDSKLRYWFGHLDSAPPVGTKIPKGGYIGKTCHNTVGGGPHVHVGVNVELLWGTGKEFKHHTNYTHGAPTIRTQLEQSYL